MAKVPTLLCFLKMLQVLFYAYLMKQARKRKCGCPKLLTMFGMVFLPGIQPDQQYGFRVEGPYDPLAGHRFNRHKLLIDPYAKAITGDIRFGPELFSFPMDRFNDRDRDLDFSDTDSAEAMPKAVVIDPSFDWEGDTHPDIPWDRTIIYEVHVRGFTQQNFKVPEALRGTYAGMCDPAAIAHLKKARRYSRRATACPPLRRTSGPPSDHWPTQLLGL